MWNSQNQILEAMISFDGFLRKRKFKINLICHSNDSFCWYRVDCCLELGANTVQHRPQPLHLSCTVCMNKKLSTKLKRIAKRSQTRRPNIKKEKLSACGEQMPQNLSRASVRFSHGTTVLLIIPPSIKNPSSFSGEFSE